MPMYQSTGSIVTSQRCKQRESLQWTENLLKKLHINVQHFVKSYHIEHLYSGSLNLLHYSKVCITTFCKTQTCRFLQINTITVLVHVAILGRTYWQLPNKLSFNMLWSWGCELYYKFTTLWAHTSKIFTVVNHLTLVL